MLQKVDSLCSLMGDQKLPCGCSHDTVFMLYETIDLSRCSICSKWFLFGEKFFYISSDTYLPICIKCHNKFHGESDFAQN